MAITNTTKSALFLKSGAVLPTAPANFLESSAPVLINPEISSNDYKRISGKLNATESYVDVANAQASFSVEHMMRSNDSAGTALETVPEFGELLKVCGFDETIDTAVVGNEFVTYTNTQTPVLGSALAVLDTNQFSFTGSLASDLTMEFEVGASAKISAGLQGYIDSATPTVVAQPSVTLSTEPLMIVSNYSTVTLGGVTLKPDKVTISTNPEISDKYTMGGASGLKGKTMTDYSLTCTIDFYVDNADYDREIAAIEAQSTAALDIKVGTDSAGALVNGQSMHVTASLVKTETQSDSDESNQLKRSVTYKILNDGSDIALTLKMGFFA